MGLFDWSEEKKERVYQEGMAAYNAENYAAALGPLTKAHGEGTARNLAKACCWLQKAAQSDDKEAAAQARDILREL